MKKIFFLFLIFLALLLSVDPVFGQRGFEVEYPLIKGERPTYVVEEYVKYIYNFALVLGIILALIILIIGGLKYLGSAGNPGLQADARNQMLSALLGLLLLFGSYLFLATVSPQLVIFRLAPLPEIPIRPVQPIIPRPGPRPTPTPEPIPTPAPRPAPPPKAPLRKLEIEYPKIKGYRPETVAEKIGEYVRYIYNFGVIIGGILALFSLLIGGFKYLGSAGNLSRQADAREQILASFLGLLILMGSYLILRTLKPEFVILEQKELEKIAQEAKIKEDIEIPHGVWLCLWEIPELEECRERAPCKQGALEKQVKKSILAQLERDCYRITKKENLPHWANRPPFQPPYQYTYVYIVGNYGVVLHSEKDWRGQCAIAFPGLALDEIIGEDIWWPQHLAPQSVALFIDDYYKYKKNSDEENLAEYGRGATLFNYRNFNEGVTSNAQPRPLEWVLDARARFFYNLIDPSYSLKVEKEKKWIVILGYDPVREPGYPLCEVFTESDYNLEDNYVGTFGGRWEEGKEIRYPIVNRTFLTPGVISEGIEEEDFCFKALPEEKAPVSPKLTETFRKVYNFLVRIGGFIAFIFLVIGGLKYLTSVGNISRQLDAKDQITSALFGLTLLLGSFVILRTINPDLVVLELEELKPPEIEIEAGVWLCRKWIGDFARYLYNRESLDDQALRTLKKEVDRCCYRVRAKENIPYHFRASHIKRGTSYYIFEGYGAIFHDQINYKGRCEVAFASPGFMPVYGSISYLPNLGLFGELSSVTPLQVLGEAQGEGVTFYRYRDFNEEKEDKDLPPLPPGKRNKINFNKPGVYLIKPEGLEEVYSIKIDKEREWGVVVNAAADNLEDYRAGHHRWCEVFDRSDNNLMDNFTSQFCIHRLKMERYPCVREATIFYGRIIESPEEIIRD